MSPNSPSCHRNSFVVVAVSTVFECLAVSANTKLEPDGHLFKSMEVTSDNFVWEDGNLGGMGITGFDLVHNIQSVGLFPGQRVLSVRMFQDKRVS